MSSPRSPLRVRWLGRVSYDDAHALQKALFQHHDNYLLLLEHPHVFTLGVRADQSNILVDPHEVGADVVHADRGGDVTYHGPGQLVGYPILNVAGKRGGGMADTVAYVHSVEQLLIDVLRDLGLDGSSHVRCGRLGDYPGVWVDPEGDNPRKIAAVGVKLARTRSMHGFALNVDCDLQWFERIVPCGISDKAVTSLAAEGVKVAMSEVVDAIVARSAERWGSLAVDRAEVVAQRVAHTPVSISLSDRKPEWMRVGLHTGPDFRRVRSLLRKKELMTVCEEAGCPNIYECWNEGTATFMINGTRCTRACAFCQVDTRRPLPVDDQEPERLADAVQAMGLEHVVITAVARDDLPDGGAAGFAAAIAALRNRQAIPQDNLRIEVLIPDCKGDPEALATIFAARPDVLNHNLETVARLQRTVRPSASYARSLAVLARAKASGLITKSSIIVGMGESDEEVVQAMADLAAVGTDIVTLGQYLRPSAQHLPVARWVLPNTFARFRHEGRLLGIAHVEASPLTRSSHHAQQAYAGVLAEVISA
ncbi:MAG: lipoyl synthase [Acidimicrobiia bacterium]|nr:lipoyl synthase [Acidimicrobiia bacterium]MYC57321.1 lipoyl synthase [Acidimicrobiia bacterium]MYG94524.1 lipoyl synthase [Acidimicrobiia bacterium]MYI31022.1 lipoyl synthase [Acidimicrobiia bacterium]